MLDDLLELMDARRGHFQLESGHHGDLWLELDQMFLYPARLEKHVDLLAARLVDYKIEAVCGPLVGGALLAQWIAAHLGIEFYYTVRVASAASDSLFAFRYRLPAAFHQSVRGKSFAIVDDTINAGSAVRATCAELEAHGAVPQVVGALLVLGRAASDYLTEKDIPLEGLAFIENSIWAPAECPLCASNLPLENRMDSISPGPSAG
jgi:orotate phosphoribosyltransferase